MIHVHLYQNSFAVVQIYYNENYKIFIFGHSVGSKMSLFLTKRSILVYSYINCFHIASFLGLSTNPFKRGGILSSLSTLG